MTRVRAIKPGFFNNEDLWEVDPLGRLLFIGLWNYADRMGRLEDRPKRLKVQILPADDCDVETQLSHLEALGFLTRYQVDGRRYIQVQNWDRHQHPHPREEASIIPPDPNEKAGPRPDPEPNSMDAEAGPRPDPEPDPTTDFDTPARLELELELEDPPATPPGHSPRARAPARPATKKTPALTDEQEEAADNFSRHVSGISGFQPTPEFLAKIATKYGALDLDEAGLAIAGYAGKHRNWLNNASILAWLRKDLDRQETGSRDNGRSIEGQRMVTSGGRVGRANGQSGGPHGPGGRGAVEAVDFEKYNRPYVPSGDPPR